MIEGMILDALLFLAIFAALFILFAFAADALLRSPGYRGPKSDHFDGKRFFNLAKEPERRHAKLSVLVWMLTRDKNVWVDREVVETKPVLRVPGKEIVATFVNHSTVLIQTEGLNIVTDPIFAERASFLSWVGPKRYVGPGVAFEDLPPIDIVLVSHNHYDHMDLATLRRIQSASKPLVITTLGNKAFLESKGIRGAVELDWWQAHEVPATASASALSIEAVPAQHFSARALSDRDKTLWAGFIIHAPHGDIYFAGDSGYGPFVQEIAARFPQGFRLGFLPIGAYEPRWFMKPVHMSPDEAYAMRKELKIARAIALHFGTFKLADDAQDEPMTRLSELSKGEGAEGEFIALRNGGSIKVE